MCTKTHCEKHLGGWVQFHTPWGYHRGVIEQVGPTSALVRIPRQYAPTTLIHHETGETDEQKLDIALAAWGYGPGPAYGPRPGGWGRDYYRPGYGWWVGGWWWWWIAFAWIFALAWLW